MEETGDEDWTTLSTSKLWDFQRQFYASENVDAWRKAVVPDFVSSNAFVGLQYARALTAFKRDCMKNGEGKILVVEIGAGHGKLGFHVVSELQRMGESEHFCYVMTDFAQDTVEFWKSHPQLSKMFESGEMDCALFDAEMQESLSLQHQDIFISKDKPYNGPVCLVCNYLFDTLRQDAFQFDEGKIYALLCKTRVRFVNSETRIISQWKRQCIEEVNSFSNGFNELVVSVLRKYEDNLKRKSDTKYTLLVPLGGLRVISILEQWTSYPICGIVGDKGYGSEQEMEGLRDPHIAVHGSFSFMVNFDAVRKYLEGSHNAKVLETPYQSGFRCLSFVLPPKSDCPKLSGNVQARAPVFPSIFQFKGKTPSRNGSAQFPEFCLEWADGMQRFDPESFSTLQRAIKERVKNDHPSLKLACALLRLSNHDAELFFKFRQAFISSAPFATRKQKADLLLDLALVREHHFSNLYRNKDVCFETGRVFMGLKEYELAADSFMQSISEFGPHYITWYNVGICSFRFGNLKQSLVAFDKCIELNSNYPEAIAWRVRAENQLKLAA